MRYPVNVKKIREIQSEIWSSIESTFSSRDGKDGQVDKEVIAHYGGIYKSSAGEFVMHTDGVGTKVLIAQDVGRYDTVGIDAIAMNVNDIICLGAEPMVAVDYIALQEEDEWLISELVKGLVKGCKESGCALIGGETAIMKDVITGHAKPFDLAATVVGKIRKKITGNEISPGDIILGLESSGIHSNGYTLARKVLDSAVWGKEMLKPTKIYVKPILELIDRVRVKGIAHITGGAFTKIRRLNKNVGYLLDEMPNPPEIFEEISHHVMNRNEMYKTFNMGVGMIVVVPKEIEEESMKILNKYTKTHRIGEVIDKPGVYIDSVSNPLTL